MKLTKYLINGEVVNPNFFKTNNYYLKIPSRILSIQIAIMGVVTVAGLLPISICIDEYRNTKYRLIIFKRNYHKL